MNKDKILGEIKRLVASNGTPPGEKLFLSETGIRQHEWRGKYWARWSDALREAGFAPNRWNEGYNEEFLIGKYIGLVREIGRLPVDAEIKIKAQKDANFPSWTPFRRLGNKAALVSKVRQYCEDRDGYEDILSFCEHLPPKQKLDLPHNESSQIDEGFVYLLKSGRYYKIGRSVSVGQRERQLSIQLPEKVGTVHSIRTDDPVGIEAYWHKRFQSKRKNGEWFALGAEDVKAFKRRKFM
jgi:hypothetical protein